MANLCTKIEIYLGRTPDFGKEVQVFYDNGVYSINEWNCIDKPEPKESDLCSDEEADYFDGMRFLRQERDNLFAIFGYNAFMLSSGLIGELYPSYSKLFILI